MCVCVCVAEKVSSLGKNWHRPCLRCERCSKTLAPGSHAEVLAGSLTLKLGLHHFVVKTVVLMCCTEDKSIFVLQHDGQPYCHKPCYAVLFGPKGTRGDAGEKHTDDERTWCVVVAFLCWWSLSLLRCKHRRRWQLHLWWPRGWDPTLRWQTSCAPWWKLQSVCGICIFFIRIFFLLSRVHFWLTSSGSVCHI